MPIAKAVAMADQQIDAETAPFVFPPGSASYTQAKKDNTTKKDKKDKHHGISFNINTAEMMSHAEKNMNTAMLQILKSHLAGRGSQ